ncbi:hypothetical protein ACQP3F_35000, partial [Escherichia coli]
RIKKEKLRVKVLGWNFQEQQQDRTEGRLSKSRGRKVAESTMRGQSVQSVIGDISSVLGSFLSKGVTQRRLGACPQ